MSASEFSQEAKSSVKISTTAKGEAQVEVKTYDGVDAAEMERIHLLAVSIYNKTASAVRIQAQPGDTQAGAS